MIERALLLSTDVAAHARAAWHELPFAAMHRFGSYRRFICRALAFIRPASFDPNSAFGWPTRYTRGIAAAT